MKKTLAKLRSKPREVRMMIAFVLALVFTCIIGAGWVMTITSGNHTKNKTKAPSPFSALTGNIKDVIVNPSGNTEIIDAGNPDTAHDESNPYQAPVTETVNQPTQ